MNFKLLTTTKIKCPCPHGRIFTEPDTPRTNIFRNYNFPVFFCSFSSSALASVSSTTTYHDTQEIQNYNRSPPNETNEINHFSLKIHRRRTPFRTKPEQSSPSEAQLFHLVYHSTEAMSKCQQLNVSIPCYHLVGVTCVIIEL